MKDMSTFLISFLFYGFLVEAFPVFTFNSTPSPEEKSLSYAFLVRDVQLPDNFILCSSIKQARFDDVGFYTIDGQDSQQWLAMEFQTYSLDTKLMVRRGKDIHIFDFLDPRLDFWYHICVKVDLKEAKMEVAVNRKWIGDATVNITNVPSKLNMKIGVGHTNKQFQGSVTNVQLFKEGNVTAISGLPCHSWPSTLLTWDPNNWKVTGSYWVLTEEFQHFFCNIRDNYFLAIHTWLSMQESLDICNQKLNNSIIPFLDDHEKFFKYINWHTNTTGGTCVDIWTPFSDNESEGVFINMNNNKETTNIDFWSKSEPNGGRDENFVVISMARKALVDVPEKTRGCSSCSISSSLLLKLDGLCKDSMIGKILHLWTISISFISDKEYKILNFNSSVGFNGWRNTYIRYIIS